MKAEANYVGLRTPNGCLVTCDGKELPPRTDLRKHTSLGFDWGNMGSGAAQLSLAILSDFCGDEKALDLYESFKNDIISSLGAQRWEMNAPMLIDWVRRALKEHKRESQGNFV